MAKVMTIIDPTGILNLNGLLDFQNCQITNNMMKDLKPVKTIKI